ncbi:calponin homology domain-containing protein [Dichotomocladium elegans]|nr:calponin homology domain-containing protein [Dichotomocladium elegans]
MGESRTELIGWMNELLQINYRKVEQAGTGAAYCQIMDSIFGDVHMSKVKFDTKHEYEYVGNFKVLQHTFEKHKVDKIIPVDRLIKCKFQDNLEFMQWIKRFWDQNFPGGSYDALARRKGGNMGPSAATAKPGSGPLGSVGRARPSSRSGPSPRNAPTENGSSAVAMELDKQINELKLTVDGLEKERDFYFGKLRDIEILIQNATERQQNAEPPAAFKEIQNVLYSTEV